MAIGDMVRVDSSTGPLLQVDVLIPDGPAPVRLILAGELDGDEVPRLNEALAEVPFDDDRREILVDAGALTFLDSAGIRALVLFQQQVADAGGRLVLVAYTRAVHRVLELTGLADLFGIGP